MSLALYIIYILLMIYVWLIIARAILTWLPIRFRGWLYRIQRVIYMLTEPYLKLFRRWIPMVRVGNAGLDLSPLVGLIVLFIVMQILLRF